MAMIDVLAGRVQNIPQYGGGDAISNRFGLMWTISRPGRDPIYFVISSEAVTGELIFGIHGPKKWSGWRYNSRCVSVLFYPWGIQVWWRTRKHRYEGYCTW